MNYILNDNHRGGSMECYVQGATRPLYFKRPIVAKIQDMPIHLAPREQPLQNDSDAQNSMMQMQSAQEEEAFKTVEVQTDYREQEVQTVPYTPKDYILRDGVVPEVLDLQKDYKWGHGLPVTYEELDKIEEDREEKWFQNALPPISDEASFTLRRKLMEEQELRKWSNKENQIKKEQNEKLYLLQSGLIEREKDVEEKNAQRIEDIKIKKTEHKNRLIAKIQRRKIKVLRKQLKRRKSIDIYQPTQPRDIIDEYSNFGSKAYAGITREGLSLDKLANKFEVQPISLTTFAGIKELQRQLPDSFFKNTIKKPVELDQNKRFQLNSDYSRLEIAHIQALRKAQQMIADQENNQEVKNEDNRGFNIHDIKERPATPIHRHPHIDDDEELIRKREDKIQQQEAHMADFDLRAQIQKRFSKRDLGVVLLQKLIRGRQMQNIMYEGKEKRMALIDELLKVAKIQDLPEEESEAILIAMHQEKVKDALMEALQGEVVSKTMDGLSKELLRFQQERKIQKTVQRADEDRRKREFIESGKRQAELILRQREQVLYDEVMQLHHSTVDNYMAHMISSTIRDTSHRQASIMTNLRREKIKAPIEQHEKKVNNHQTIIRDLITSFLNPNISRTKVARQLELEQLRFDETSKKAVNSSLVALGQLNKK